MEYNISSTIFYCDKLGVTTDVGIRASLISNDGQQVLVPLLCLVASSPVVASAAAGDCGCDDVVLLLPDFTTETIIMFVNFICGKVIYGNSKDIAELKEICKTFMLKVDDNIEYTNLPINEETARWIILNNEVDNNNMETDCSSIDPTQKNSDNVHEENYNIRPNLVDESEEFPNFMDLNAFVDESITVIKEEPQSTDEETGDVDFTVDSSTSSQNLSTQTVKCRGRSQKKFLRGPDGRYTCTLCDKSYSASTQLKFHMRVHTGEWLYCEFCEMKFIKNGDLFRHRRIHTGVKPHQCPVCHQQFVRKEHLKSHASTHKELKPFECPICTTTFAEQKQLDRHLQTHTVTSGFQCNRCKQCFDVKSNLLEHMEKHPSAKLFKCEGCEKSFAWKKGLERHRPKCVT